MTASTVKRPYRGAAALLVAVAVTAFCGSCTPVTHGQDQRAEYCAIMPDAVGLYVNNAVTQMGVRIGKITAVAPETLDVRVNFTVDQRLLPDNVKAITRSPSILADRSLELVGNYEGGARLRADACIPLNRSFTPKSLSQVIGSATDFINAINVQGSTNIGDVVKGLDESLRNQGPKINSLLSTSSTVLDTPDQAIGDIGSITKNLAVLTSTIRDIDPTLKQVLLDSERIGPDVATLTGNATGIFYGLTPVISMVADIERELGPELQQTLDTTSVAVRKLSPRAPFYASLLNVAPRLINGVANFIQTRQDTGFGAFTIRYRPPLYRVRTPDGAFQCGYMNAAVPGSCANVNGTPYAVDIALLQYVLTQAANR